MIPKSLKHILCTALLAISMGPAVLSAQVLPPHGPLRILIVSDEVNPHGLSDEDLTQPGDISAALLSAAALNLDNGTNPVLEISTDSIEEATALLELPASDAGAYDVLIYFAHRTPNGADSQTRQEAFVTAVDSFLTNGGGVLAFHHGIYRTAGKESIQDLLGAEATGGVPWNTVDGQNVIAVAPDHFIARHGVSYGATVSYEDTDLGIPLADYPFFNNTPDERYPTFSLLPAAGQIVPLFASDYDAANHLLGYVQLRPEWPGAVVMYQPGEYQPNALGPGNNFQILLNAIVYVASYATGEIVFGDSFESGDLSFWTVP